MGGREGTSSKPFLNEFNRSKVKGSGSRKKKERFEKVVNGCNAVEI